MHNDSNPEVVMKGCVVRNGEIRDSAWAKARIATCDLVIAANGGADHLCAMDLVPNLIVGDMDSLREESWLSNENVEWVKFPKDKDKSDAELAVEIVFERGCDFISLFGAVGGRPDHMLGNNSMLAKYRGQIAIVDNGSTLVAVDQSEKCILRGEPGAIVSLIPFPVAERVTTSGLRYSLIAQDLLPGTRGISNEMSAPEACICIGGGLLLVYIENADRTNE